MIWPKEPHTNKSPGHWETIQEAVEILEGYGGYAKIYVNNALSKEIPGAEPDNRPDIMAVRWDGKIDQFEVKSITDNKVELDKRMEGNQKMMGTRAGKIKTLFIPEEKGWHLNGK